MINLYSTITLLIILAMTIMIVSICVNSSFNRKKKKYAILLLILIAFCSFLEWTGVTIQGFSTDKNLIEFKRLHITVKLLELSLAPFVGVLPIFALKNSKMKMKVFDYVVISILCVNIILEIISAFTGFIYYVDENNVYHHGSCYFLYLMSYSIGILYFIYTAIKIFKHQYVTYLIPNLLVVLFICISIVIQLIHSNIKIDWLSIAIAVLLMFKFYGDMLANTDALTGLLNRLDFENNVRNISSDVIIIYFDVNHFKIINDKYGHVYGDNCLVEIAQFLRKIYEHNGKVYRYGGDEFCVILDKNIEYVNMLNDNFNSLVESKIKEDSRFPSVACGYAIFDPINDTIIDAIDRADQEMYKNKNNYKNYN